MKKILAFLSLAVLALTVTAAFAAADGATIYKSCAGCHGADGSKQTGESVPLKGQTADALVKKLQGYASGSYGGKQKKIMENIASKHSAEEIAAVCDYISKL